MTKRGRDSSGKGIASRITEFARDFSQRVPGHDFLQKQIEDAERAAAKRLMQRIEELQDAPPDRSGAQVSAPSASSRSRGLTERYQALLDRSLNQTPETALEAFYGQLLDELVPDQLRLLNSASGGYKIPIAHLELFNRKGSGGRALAYLSRAGNEAGVMRNELTPQYLMHLESMGLLECGPADPAANDKYEIIENESTVRKAIEQIGKERVYKTKLSRETMKLSSLGHAFLAACSGHAAK